MLRRISLVLLLVPCAGSATGMLAPSTDATAPTAPAVAESPRYVLMDTHRRMVSNEDFAGRFQLITFGYTSCPDVCPTTLSTMSQALRALGPLADRLQLMFISVDPERDTPEVLARYTAFFDAGLVGLTGTLEQIRACTAHFHVQFRKFREPGAAPSDYAVDHTSGMYLLGPDGAFIRRFPEGLPAVRLAGALKQAMQAEAVR